jgi:hypothetical protein
MSRDRCNCNLKSGKLRSPHQITDAQRWPVSAGRSDSDLTRKHHATGLARRALSTQPSPLLVSSRLVALPQCAC